jgi:glycerol-3-phosphate acyltransferase PlsY
MVWLIAIGLCLLGYLFGSFPAGYLAGRIAGIDVRTVGSGNIGATNVLRVLGKPWGYAVFFVDAFKGFAAVRLAFFVVQQSPLLKPYAEYFAILTGAMCIVGHNFPVWLGFKGGKGVATSAGTLFGLMPLVVPVILVIWVIVFETTRYVSVASMMAAISLPLVVGLFLRLRFLDGPALLYFSTAIALLVLWRHRSNFSRLLKGTEQRFTRK